MTQDEEKAAKWAVVERYDASKKKLIALRGAMGEIGKQFEKFAEGLRYPETHSFEISEQHITLGARQQAQACLSKGQSDWDALCALLKDYQDTKRESEHLAAEVKGLGISL